MKKHIDKQKNERMTQKTLIKRTENKNINKFKKAFACQKENFFFIRKREPKTKKY